MIERLRERGIEVSLTDAARTRLGDLGYDPVYGARPLKRVIQKQLVDRLARAVLAGELRAGDAVAVDVTPDDELTLTPAGAQDDPAVAA